MVDHTASDFESGETVRKQVALFEENRRRRGDDEAGRIPGSRTWLVFKNGNRQLISVGSRPSGWQGEWP